MMDLRVHAYRNVMFVAVGLLCLLASAHIFAGGSSSVLTFEKRVAAQRAIEEVYWRHRTWPEANSQPKPALSVVMPERAIRAKVEDYLKKSAALESYWSRPIAAEQLQAEMNRMAARTKNPQMLRELFAALGNDPRMIAETLARPRLVDRLIRNWYAWDERFHRNTRAQAAAEAGPTRTVGRMRALGGEYREIEWVLQGGRTSVRSAAIDATPREIVLSPDEWDRRLLWLAEQFPEKPATLDGNGIAGRREASVGSLPTGRVGDLYEERDRFVIAALLEKEEGRLRVATVSWAKRSFQEWWQAVRGELLSEPAGLVGDFSIPLAPNDACTDDTWTTSFGSSPDPRAGHAALWTGSEMIVWGGANFGYRNDGWRYDPATDTWTKMSQVGAPPSSFHVRAVWTGTQMIVWGGDGGPAPLGTGARYTPATDTWAPVSATNAPSARWGHVLLWAGTVMIAWGGDDGAGTFFADGARYDPSTDTWSAMSGVNAPEARSNQINSLAVYTGSEMIVWGGWNGTSQVANGGRYNPSTDTWTATSTVGAPSARNLQTSVWSGTEMIVWGGWGGSNSLGDGGRYNPSTDTWMATSTIGAPIARGEHTAIWTGSSMVVWGGDDDTMLRDDGGRYDPVADTWSAVTVVGAPGPRDNHSAVWTGSEMIVWGGFSPGSGTDTGGRYDPTADSWVPTSVLATPDARAENGLIWTGSEAVAFGGLGPDGDLDTGWRYDPTLDMWTPTSTLDAPPARNRPTGVWTGSEVIFWGGFGPDPLDSGGRYSPSMDLWTATSLIDAPVGRAWHSAVWTGTEMIVWGGRDIVPNVLATGGRYSPASDSWTPTDTIDAPSARGIHRAVWTGSEMIVWGGTDLNAIPANTGGRYDPSADSWSPTDTIGAPDARFDHAAIWTGDRMIVWGGFIDFSLATVLDSGGLYDPVADAWSPTTTTGAPSARGGPMYVWSGAEMIVWGGTEDASVVLEMGGRYDPVLDIWTSVSTTDMPIPGTVIPEGNAVWTGTQMFVYGGQPPSRSNGLYCALAPDTDGDGIPNISDNCPALFNPDQRDGNGNGLGDVCDVPTVIAVTPADTSVGVSTATNVTVIFSEPVSAASVTPTTFTLTAGGFVPGAIGVSPSGLEAVLDPDAALATGTTYTVDLTSGVLDLAGNPLVPFTSSFTTDATPPASTELPDVADEVPGIDTAANTGSSVAAGGDLGGGSFRAVDGIDDFVSGAPGLEVDGKPEAGAVAIYFGSPLASERTRPDIVFVGEDAHDRVGVSVASNFDFNGDGTPDVLVGAEQFNRSGQNDPLAGCDDGQPCGNGKAYLIYFDPADLVHYPNIGNPDVTDYVSLSLVGTAIPGVVFTGSSFGDRAGFAVDGGGLINADTKEDIIIGAPGADPGDPARPDAGMAYVIYDAGSLSGTIALDRVANGQGDEIDGAVYLGAAAGDNFGFAVSFPGDVMGTAGDDIAIGAPGADVDIPPAPLAPTDLVPNAGVVNVPQGGGTVIGIIESSDIGVGTPGSTTQGDQDDMQLGYSLAGGGDNLVDGDQDLLMGAPNYDPDDDVGDPMIDAGLVAQTASRLQHGIITVSQIGADTAVDPDAVAGVIYTGAAAGDKLGIAVAVVGDVSGNGLDDMAMGAPFSSPNGVTEAGTTYLVEGTIPSDLHRGVISVSEIGVTISGQQLAGVEAGEHSGSALSAGGDLSDDAQNDMLVGAPDNDVTTDDNAGTVYIVLDSDPAVNDGDGDGVLDALDCDPGNNQVWAQPGEVSDMTLTHDQVLQQTEVTWTAPGDLGGTAVRYDTIRSTDPGDFIFAAACVESDDGADTMAIDSDMLPSGVAAYYLVRAENDCPDGMGSVGEDSEGLLRTAINCP